LADTVLVVPINTLDVTGIAIERTFGAALTGRLARHALSQSQVSIGAEWAGCLAVNSIQERVRAEGVTSLAELSVVIVALKTHIVTLFASVSLCIIVGSGWTLLIAPLLVKDGLASQNIAALALQGIRF
jgi:hypothetical protein